MNLRFEQPFENTFRSTEPKGIAANNPISDDWVLKQGVGRPILFVDRVAVTPEVPTEGVVDVEIEVVNAATFVGPTDPDKCPAGRTDGFRYEVNVNPSWTGGDGTTNCLGMSDIGGDRALHTFDFDAPADGGNYSVSVSVETAESNVGHSETYNVAVTGQGGGDDPIRPGPGEGDTGDTSDSPIEDLLPSGDLNQGLVILVLVLLLLLVIGFVI